MKNINRVEQPLRELINDKVWEKLLRISTGKEELDSILSCYYTENKDNNSNNRFSLPVAGKV